MSGTVQAAEAEAGSHTLDLRVRYAESDQMGVAHHGAYIPWFEAARIEWLRARGASYRELEATGVFMPVVDLQVRYRRSVKFDDAIRLVTTAQAEGPSRLAFRTRVLHGDVLCAEATVTVATVNAQGRPIRLPVAVAAFLAG